MKTGTITSEDVKKVAKDLNFYPTEKDVATVLEMYPSEQAQDPTGSWNLVVEHCLTQVVTPMEHTRYKGKLYPTKTFTVIIDENEVDITISVQSLSDALGDKKEKNKSLEQRIDETIYFYVDNDVIQLDNKEIAEKHLDEPLVYVPTKTFRITYRKEVYIKADTEAEAIEIFENMSNEDLEKQADFVERVSVDEE